MKKLLLITLVMLSSIINAQIKSITPKGLTLDQQEVLDVIIRLFDGMREADSAKVHSVFGSDPQMYTAFISKDGKPVLRKDVGGLEKFLVSIGSPHDVVYDEPIWDVDIKIDGNLANVWTKYAFYAGKNFSHCGVDAFMMNKTDQGWKIFHLTDTRRRQGCKVPEAIKKGRGF